jgi:phosphate starvation-inducible PhoH-like protein
MIANKEKKVLKTEPNLRITLNEEQKDLIRQFYEYDFTFALGDFGSGKTQSAVYAAISAFRKKQFNKIWITRPILRNNLGILPAGIDEKLAPYIFPIMQCFDQCQSREATDKMRAAGLLQIMPIDVAKGVTFIDSVVIVDEFQDLTYEDFRTIITRVADNSKIIFCGSKQQISKQIGNDSCIHKVINNLKVSGKVGWVELTSNHRNKALTDIIKLLEG